MSTLKAMATSPAGSTSSKMDVQDIVLGIQPAAECLRQLLIQNGLLQEHMHNLDFVKGQIEERNIQIHQAERAKLQTNNHENASQEFESYIVQLRNQVAEMVEDCTQTRNNLLTGIVSAIQTAATAKDHLLNKDLHEWKVRQKLAQIGPKSEQQALQDELDRLDPIFEQCGDELRKLRSIVEQLEQDVAQQLGPGSFEQNPGYRKLLEYRNSINMIIYQFVWESCVVARQPPCVLMKVRAPQSSDPQRRATVRPACQPVLRLLGGTSLGLRVGNKEEVACFIISEEQARNLGTPGYEVKPIGNLLHNKARFESDDRGRYFAIFQRPMALTDISRPAEGTEAIPRLRYYLLFLVKISGAVQMCGSTMTLQGGKLSLPVAALVHPRQEYEQGGDAYIFWDLAFSEGQGILTNVPREAHPGVPWPEAAKALNFKFQQLIEGSKPDVQVKVGLSDIAITHLAERFFNRQPSGDYSKCRLPWSKFFREEILRRDNGTPCTFREWFYKAAEIVHRKLLDHWNDGLILGFCSKQTVEGMLIQQNRPMMIIKFSDNNLGCLIITYFIPGSQMPPQHLKVAAVDLDVVPLTRCVRQCPELHHIQWIYPNHPISDLWKHENQEENKKKEPDSPQAQDPYARRMFIGMQVEGSPPPRWDVPPPPANLDLDTIYDWLSEQDIPGRDLQVIPAQDLDVNLGGMMPLIDPSILAELNAA